MYLTRLISLHPSGRALVAYEDDHIASIVYKAMALSFKLPD